MLHLPIIDLAELRDGSVDRRREIAAALGDACRQTGFFCVAGHGIAPAHRKALFEASHRFFSLPAASKDACSIRLSPHNRGYVAMAAESLDPTQPPDRKEAFNIGLDLPPDAPEVLEGRPFMGVNFWPDLPGWREQMLHYYDRCLEIGRVLHRGFSLDLGLTDETFFDSRIDRPAATLRLLHYPAARAGAAPAAGQPGAGVHTDYGVITLLMTDGVGGLEVRRRDGEWIGVADTGDLILCNIGDCLMRWTNDVYVSTPHRVNVPEQERYSIAFFLDPNPGAVVDPRDLAPDRAPLYPPVTAGDYLLGRLTATYDHLQAAGAPTA